MALLLPAGAAAGQADEPKSWRAEVGVLVGHHSNFFFRGRTKPRLSDTLVAVYGNAEVEVNRGRSSLTFYFDGNGTFTRDIDDADYQRLGLGLQYKRRRTRVEAQYFAMLNRLSLLGPDGVFFDIQGAHLQARQGLAPGWWVGGRYAAEWWSFDPVQQQRDSVKHTVAATLRLPLGRALGVRASVFRETRDARAPDFDWRGNGLGVALEARLGERVRLFARFKHRGRTYYNAPVGDRNFGREDTVRDLLVNLRWWIGRNWGLRVQNFFRDGDSTRLDRNFEGNRILAGLFVVL